MNYFLGTKIIARRNRRGMDGETKYVNCVLFPPSVLALFHPPLPLFETKAKGLLLY